MKMTFKRGFASGLLTMTAFVGVYLGFFNHPPAADTLEANAHHSGGKMGPPKLDFGPPADSDSAAGGSRNFLFEKNDAAERTKDKTLRDEGTNHVEDIVSKKPFFANGRLENNSRPTEFEKYVQNAETPKQKKNGDVTLDKPGQQKSVKPSAAAQNANGDDVREGKEAAKIKPQENSVSGAAHGSFPKFDWDKWVKENNLVDVGTIWGYCDNPDPPEIGKVLLMKDEDKGGLKVVVVLNTTFDEPVESGSIVVSVTYGGMGFYERSMDICTLYEDEEPEPGEERDTFFDCPMAAGSKFYMKEIHIPFFVPSGDFKGQAKLMDQRERSVLCTSAELTL